MKITVREEEERDYRRSEEIIREAFSYPGRVERGGIGCPYEHWMVHELRKRDGAGISLVAEADGVPAGYVACSRAQVLVGDTDALPVVNIGPIGVLPEYQRKGIGKALFHACWRGRLRQGMERSCFSDGLNTVRRSALWRREIMASPTGLERSRPRFCAWS